MEDNTTVEEKKERLAKLNELINKYALESNKKMDGNVYNVLIIGPSDKQDKYMGYTDNMKLVNINNADKGIIIFKEHIDSVKEQLIDFIVKNENEPIVIVIDTLLISQSPNQPSIGKYYTDGEYSDEIYKFF